MQQKKQGFCGETERCFALGRNDMFQDIMKRVSSNKGLCGCFCGDGDPREDIKRIVNRRLKNFGSMKNMCMSVL